MAPPAEGRKSNHKGQSKNDSRSLKRKRDVDDYAALQKAVSELVSCPQPARAQPNLSGPQSGNKRLLRTPLITNHLLRPRSLSFQDPDRHPAQSHTPRAAGTRYPRRRENRQWEDIGLLDSSIREPVSAEMDGVRWVGCAHHIANARAGDSDIRSVAEDRAIPHFLRRARDWGTQSTGRAGAVGEDEYSCLYAWANAAAYGSNCYFRRRQSADAGAR